MARQLEIQLKNTFLEFREPQESFSRGISWCPGDKPCSELPPLKGTSVSAIAEAKQAPNLADNVVNKKAQQTEEGHATPDDQIIAVHRHNAKCNPCVYFASSYGCTSPRLLLLPP